MKMLVANFVAILVSGSILMCSDARSQEPKASDAMLKAVVHINFEDPKRQEHALGNIENILKEAPDTIIEVVCHGEGITLVERKTTKQADKIAALIKQQVSFVGCENTMRKKSLNKEDLLAGVGTVPSGAVEVLRKQQEGYGYFRP